MKSMGWSQGLSVTADGTGVVPLAGAAAVNRHGFSAAVMWVAALGRQQRSGLVRIRLG
jgi:hypothetical protein